MDCKLALHLYFGVAVSGGFYSLCLLYRFATLVGSFLGFLDFVGEEFQVPRTNLCKVLQMLLAQCSKTEPGYSLLFLREKIS